jgi:Ser/Thr protein kinase RdoA (MazF antagonist)
MKELVLPHYAIENSAECTFFYRGLNDTYQVSAKDRRFALRLYRHRWRTEEQIRGEIGALLHLAERGVPVPSPIPRIDGEWLTAVDAPEGRRWAVLFRWVDGDQPRYIEPAHASLYGQTAARLHIAGDSLPSNAGRAALDASYLLDEPAAALRPALKTRPLLLSRFDALVERVAARLERAREELWDWGFCHGDLHCGNAHVDSDRFGLFDFDCCGVGWRVYDLATYRWASRLRGVADRAWKPFIDAYLQVRPEAAANVEHVSLFVVLRQIWLHGYYAWNAVEGGAGYQSDRFLGELVAFLEELESEVGVSITS